MRRILVLLAVVALAAALPAAAQMDANTVGRVYHLKVKPGSEQAFEAGVKKHAEWHKSQNDTWAWHVWEVETGERSGQYVFGTFGHGWGDFDQPTVSGEADAKDYYANMAPHVAGFDSLVVVALPDVSRAPESMTPSALASVYTIHPRVGTTEEFLRLLGRVKAAIEKTKWGDPYTVYMLQAGGETGTFYIVVSHASWAAMGATTKSFEAMLAEALGHSEARAVTEAFDRIIKSESVDLVRYRADLSYAPAAK